VVRTSLIGDYNVSNLLGVIGALRSLGIELEDAARVCGVLSPVPGRMHRVSAEARYHDEAENYENMPEVVVDYAHTPDALEKALRALQPLAQGRDGKLWCVFGCGGNRDATKRPLMGAIAQKHANCVIVTSDNPRNEEPTEILAQIVRGMTPDYRPVVIEDRRLAISQAVQLADSNDVILIAGKGHEDYQDVAGVKHPFSDVTEAHAALMRYGDLRRSQS
jgi:UDP-N-acetylmuramoyl-L-alanyl-D-glutamate--2,6-diaminopimelate ligase